MTRSRSSPAEASPVEGRFSRGRRCWKTLRLQSCKQYGVDWTSWWKVNARTFSSGIHTEMMSRSYIAAGDKCSI
ncbi:hypothetical protein LINPERHAP2_LOCUS43675 [Linum perenne]